MVQTLAAIGEAHVAHIIRTQLDGVGGTLLLTGVHDLMHGCTHRGFALSLKGMGGTRSGSAPATAHPHGRTDGTERHRVTGAQGELGQFDNATLHTLHDSAWLPLI